MGGSLRRVMTAAVAVLAFATSGAPVTAVDDNPLRDGVDALDAGDEGRYATALAKAANTPGIPALYLQALRDRDTELLTIGAELVESTDQELYDVAMHAIEDEQSFIPEPPEPSAQRPPRPDHDAMLAADLRGIAVLERIDFRGLQIPETVRTILGPQPTPGPAARPPRPAEFEAARRELLEFLVAGTPPPPPAPVEPPGDSGMNQTLLVVSALSLGGLTLGLGWMVRDRRHGHLVTLAMTDGLTGLNNRRQLDSDLRDPTRRGSIHTAMLMIDIDNFKAFNDAHGHAMGDDVLRRVATAISASLRDGDISYRYGGEEFSVLLPDTDDRHAHDVAERVRSAIEAIELPGEAHVTASVGVAAGLAEQVSTTVDHADMALYAAKTAGRNRVVTAPPR